MITSTGYDELKDVMAYLAEVPYDVARRSLYHPAELYEGFDPNDESSFDRCFDSVIYQRYKAMGQHTDNVKELLARTLHDHCIHTALGRFFKTHDHRRSVGVMGGHALLRTDKAYREIALLSQRLTQEGFIMLSGGGPGAMEATHLGAWMAGFSKQDLEDALGMMSIAPSFKDAGWLDIPEKWLIVTAWAASAFAAVGGLVSLGAYVAQLPQMIASQREAAKTENQPGAPGGNPPA